MAEPRNKDDDRAVQEERVRKEYSGVQFSTEVFYENDRGEIKHFRNVECGGHDTLEAALECAEHGKAKILAGMRSQFEGEMTLVKALSKVVGAPDPVLKFPKVWVAVAKTHVTIVEFAS